MRKLLWIALLLLPAATAHASGAELSLMAGYRFDGPAVEVQSFDCVLVSSFFPCPLTETIEARDGEAFGLILDLPFREHLMFEILISHQSGELEREEPIFFDIFPEPINETRFDLTYLHLGLLRQWQRNKVSPFAAVGIGIAQLEAEKPIFFFTETIDEDRLSASLAGGVKIDLGKRLGVRLEGRGYWADMPESVGEDLIQLELSSGLIFKL